MKNNEIFTLDNKMLYEILMGKNFSPHAIYIRSQSEKNIEKLLSIHKKYGWKQISEMNIDECDFFGTYYEYRIVWDKKDGYYVVFNDGLDGPEKITDGHIKNYERDGLWREWQDGKIIESLIYKDGNVSGSAVIEDDFGNKWKGKYDDGARQGQWTKFFYNGKVEIVEYYKDGLKDGISTGFWITGKKRWEVEYKNDIPIKIWKNWDEDGNIIPNKQRLN